MLQSAPFLKRCDRPTSPNEANWGFFRAQRNRSSRLPASSVVTRGFNVRPSPPRSSTHSLANQYSASVFASAVNPVGFDRVTAEPWRPGRRRGTGRSAAFSIFDFCLPTRHPQLNLQINSMDLQRIAAVQRSASLVVRLIITPGKAPAPHPPCPPVGAFLWRHAAASSPVSVTLS